MKKGDIIEFGNYPQDSYGNKSPIEWLVLDVKGYEALLVSRYGLNRKQYHKECVDITWEDCDLRKWLNNDFIKSAFSEEEANKIKVSEFKNEDNPVYRTRDRIFCLSITEAKQYFRSDNDRQSKPTAYAQEQGVYVYNDCCYWWLRSLGDHQGRATLVCPDGEFALGGGTFVQCNAVRPALRIIFDEEQERKQREELEELERREQEERIRIQREIQTFGIPLKKGAFIKYGNYPLTADGQKAPIEWLILDFNEKTKEALLISRYGLDRKPYKHDCADITWEDCDLRRWLNNDFIKSAFSEEEAKKIKVSELKNEDNPKFRTSGGNNTKDRIFCLSFNEAEYYFGSDIDRQCKPTAYAKRCAYDKNGRCYWWLRSPGRDQFCAMVVDKGGALGLYGSGVHDDNGAVRPALRIIYNETLEQRKQREEEELRQRVEQERRQRELQTIIKKGIRKGMIIRFGAYPQYNDSSRTPIEWLVLDFNEKTKEALLISRYGLDCKPYGHKFSTTWEDCDLRKWLNNDFIKSAFSEGEAKKIKVSELKNEDNPKYRTRGGNNTKDRIFCLSINEAEHYFGSDIDRQCKPTAYAGEQGAHVYNDCSFWWLRSPGLNQRSATIVNSDGALRLYGYDVLIDYYAVRPALWIICNL